MTRQGVRAWLLSRADAYATVVVALCLNVPLLSLALSRHLEGVNAASVAGVYAQLVFLGYYALLLFVFVTAFFALAAFSRRLAVGVGAGLLFLALTYLAANSFVHRVYRLHVDAFWLEYLMTSSDGLGAPPTLIATFAALVLAVAGVQWVLFRLARRIRRRGRLAGAFLGLSLAAFVASQAIHVVAYHRNDTRITSITPQLPFYYPVVSQKNAARYGDLLPLELTPDAAEATASLRYPLKPIRFADGAAKQRPNILLIVLESWRYDMMDSVVSPRIAGLARHASVFDRHFSSGNSTPSGIFGMFYGIHPTYWAAVKANSALIHNPVLIDALEARGYSMGIFAESHFEKHKIKDTIFRDIEVREPFRGHLDDQKDADMTERLIEFMDERKGDDPPWFGFAFYKSTHYSYWYPPEAARFRPSQKLNIPLAGNRKDPTLYLNDYRNSIYYADSLVGRVLDHLERSGAMENTVVIVTSDHGEEFNDNQAGYWGHTGNFTQYQTRVPLVIHLPGVTPRRTTTPTAHVDLPTTLLTRVLDCPGDPSDYSNGLDLFGPLPARRPLVLASYVNHAIVLDDDVHAIYPMYVQRYKLHDIRAAAGPPRPELVKQAMEEMHRFYSPEQGPHARKEAAPHRAARVARAGPG